MGIRGFKKLKHPSTERESCAVVIDGRQQGPPFLLNIIADKHMVLRIGKNLQFGVRTDIDHVGQRAAQIGINVLIDQRHNVIGRDARLQDLHHDNGKIGATSRIDQNRLIPLHNEVRIAMKVRCRVMEPHPENVIRDFDRTVVMLLDGFHFSSLTTK